MLRLTDFPVGKSAMVAVVGCPRTTANRLLELGATPGTVIRLIRRDLISGLVEIEVRGCLLSLRWADAEQIVLHDPTPGI